MSSSPSPTDNNSTLAMRHSVNGGGVFGGFLSSWMGYFTGRNQYDNDVQHMFAQNQQMMDRMERLMNKLEEKLESLEDRKRNNIGEGNVEEGGVEESFAEGEDDDGCDDEESISISSEDLKMKGEALRAYQDMVATNRTDWAYSAGIHMSSDPTLTDRDEYNICRLFNIMKGITTKMRRGEYHFDYEEDVDPPSFHSSLGYDIQGVRLDSYEDDANDYEAFTPYHITLRLHWEEFVDALDDFDLILDIMPDDSEPCFQISHIEIPVNILRMIMKSLEGKSFRHYNFIDNDFGRYGILAVIDLLDSNQHLQSLTLSNNSIDEEDEGDLCDAIMRHPALSTVHLDECLEERMFIPCELIRSNQLVEISVRDNDLRLVSSEQRQDFTDALVSNRSLENLDLTGIYLNDEDLNCFATVLAGNSTLKRLCLHGSHHFTNAAVANFGGVLRTNTTLQFLSGIEGCYDALFDDNELNSAADSNHTCDAKFRNWLKNYNYGDPTGNRQRKIYNILARRHEKMCNVQHFDDIDINLLPDILVAVQYCAIDSDSLIYNANEYVNSLSITFEIMRKWDKALSLYKTLSDNVL